TQKVHGQRATIAREKRAAVSSKPRSPAEAPDKGEAALLFGVRFEPNEGAQPAGLRRDFLAFRIGLCRGELGAKFLQFQLASASAGQLAAAFRARHQAISL